MAKLIQLKCENCGAPLDKDLHCAYCGSQYSMDMVSYRGVVLNKGMSDDVVILRAQHLVDAEFLRSVISPTAVLDSLYDEFARQFARELRQYIKISAGQELMGIGQIITGALRIIPPDKRF